MRQRVAQLMLSEFDAGRSLEAIGASLSCYVPRLIRHLTLDALLCISQVELSRHYDFGSWAIGDLVLLLERLADEFGVHAPEPAPLEHVSVAGLEIVGHGIARSIPIGPRPEIELAATELPSESSEGEQRTVTDTPGSRRDPDSDVNGDELLGQFELMRQVLETHAKHPLLNEQLREFLEPNDSDIPFGFLGHSVREALETPFPKWTRRWIGHKPIRCLLTLLSRAVASIRSMTGYPDENATIADDSLRRRTDLVPRELHVDGESWRAWCDAIHVAGLQRLKLGMVAECLRDLPASLWDQPLANFTTSSLSQLAGIGPKRMALVVAAVSPGCH